MPLLGTRGAASARGFGFSGLSPQVFWIGILEQGGIEVAYGVTADTSNNTYIAGLQQPSGSPSVQAAKYNTSGTIQWQKKYTGTTFSTSGTKAIIKVASSGNVYVLAYQSAGTIVIKLDNNGAIQWQTGLNAFSNATALALDSSENIYFTCEAVASSTTVVAKLNSSGTLQWQRELTSGSNVRAIGVAIDSSSNVYVSGYISSSPIKAYLVKYNTSGTLQWQRELAGPSGNSLFNGWVAIDSANNVYFAVADNTGSALCLVKYNSSGTLQWQRKLTGGGLAAVSGVACDSSNNIYVCGGNSSSGTVDYYWAKYDSSGTIQFQRTLGTSVNDTQYDIATSLYGTLYVTGESTFGSSRGILSAKLPSDGSKTGTYSVGGTSVVYGTASSTDAAGSLTDAAGSLTDAAGSRTTVTGDMTASDSTLTSSVTTL